MQLWRFSAGQSPGYGGRRRIVQNAILTNIHVQAMYNLGNLLWDVHGDARGAREQFEAALSVNLDNVSTLCNLGQLTALTDENNLEGAEAYFQQALAVDGDHVPTLFEYSCLRARTGDDSRAQELLERALKLDSQHLPSLALRANYLIAQGKQSDAEQLYSAIMRKQGSTVQTDADFLCDYAQVVLKASKSYSKVESFRALS